ncbi:MAG: aldehyde dehydrogenase family protein [Bacteroidetes bacterium]|nr:aldehyde dehydrogenase family protein [Bacteroidota bacterium]
MSRPFYIGGKQRTSSTVAAVRNPYSGSVIDEICYASPNDIIDAVISGQEAFQLLSQLSSFERSQILLKTAQSITKRKEEFAQLITAEAGKPIKFSRAEVDRAIVTFEIASEEAKRINGETIPLDVTSVTKGKQGMVKYFPIGIVACISPFNFPLNLVAHKIAPAIAAGNSFILKPPPQTPLTSLLLAELLLESGLPAQTINIVPCSNETAEMLVTDERIAMLSFTGSANVGWKLKAKAGKKKVLLELGGNAGVILDESADIDSAVPRCVAGGFGYAGQVCIKVQRILVHDKLKDEVFQKIIGETKKVITGNPAEEQTVSGPMISEQEALRVEHWINEAVSQGAEILYGGKRNGVFVEPTLLTNINPSMKVYSEEVFGPVITIQTFSSIEEAVQELNNSRYGLQAGMYSNNHSNIQYAYRHLHVGGVIVNDYPTFRVDSMPYGGIKDSGFGREGISYAIREMMEQKLLVYES